MNLKSKIITEEVLIFFIWTFALFKHHIQFVFTIFNGTSSKSKRRRCWPLVTKYFQHKRCKHLLAISFLEDNTEPFISRMNGSQDRVADLCISHSRVCSEDTLSVSLVPSLIITLLSSVCLFCIGSWLWTDRNVRKYVTDECVVQTICAMSVPYFSFFFFSLRMWFRIHPIQSSVGWLVLENQDTVERNRFK